VRNFRAMAADCIFLARHRGIFSGARLVERAACRRRTLGGKRNRPRPLPNETWAQGPEFANTSISRFVV
jgi:hypothetical protein